MAKEAVSEVGCDIERFEADHCDFPGLKSYEEHIVPPESGEAPNSLFLSSFPASILTIFFEVNLKGRLCFVVKSQ